MISIYCKDDLPTWHEMYYEFWNKKLFTFNPLDENEIDLYWKIEHNKMILGFACNQLNKMILENKINLLNFVKETLSDDQIKNFYFILSNDIEVCVENMPSIYALKIPSTKKYSIFSTDYKRKDLSTITQSVELRLIIVKNSYDFKIIDISSEVFSVILNKIMTPIIDYFTEPIGWK